jgi:aspartate/methionine/tyrosine aminotransferase
LREAVAEEIRVQYSLPSPSRPIEGKVNGEHDSRSGVTAANVGITTGCNMAFLTLLMALCPPGSSVLLPLPAYFNNSMCLSLQSVKPVYVPSDPSHSFLPNISAARFQLKSHAGKQVEGVRMIVLVSPNNPTGSVMPPDVIRQWYDLAKEFGVALVLDETYRDFVEDGAGGRGKPHGLFELKDWDRTLICLGSFSSE